MVKDFYKYDPNYEFLWKDAHLNMRLGYLVLGGSHAYGLNVEGSDVDVRGFFYDNVYNLLSVGHGEKEQVEDKKTDTLVFSLRKFVRLCLNCNPNCLELLGVRDKEVLLTTPEAEWLRDNYSLFLSKQAYEPYRGFAGHLRKVYYGERVKGNHAKANKALMNCLRVLYTGRDLFAKKELVVYRPEREFLLEVRKGNYSEEPVNEPLVLDLYTKAKEEFEYAYKNTELPEYPNYEEVDDFVVRSLLKRAGLR